MNDVRYCLLSLSTPLDLPAGRIQYRDDDLRAGQACQFCWVDRRGKGSG